MASQLHDSNYNADRIGYNPCNTLSRRVIFFVFFFIVILVNYVFILSDGYSTLYYQYVLKKSKATQIEFSNTSVKTLEKFHQTPQNSDTSVDDLKLYDTLQRRAKNNSNRYYLKDFEYFRMIRDEFSKTKSAEKLRRVAGFVPLMPTVLLDSKEILFIVMGSAKYIGKSMLLTKTWLQWTQGNFFIFADFTNASIPLMTLPQLENKPSREDAQHRQFVGSQWLINNKSELVKRTKWFVFADDDTWINVPALVSYLEFFDYHMLLSIGFVWDDIWVKGWSYFSGGAGMVYSQAAFMSIIPAIYTNECPFKGWNDVTLGYCQKQKGITKIHSDRFFWNQPAIPSVGRPIPVDYLHNLTFHYVNDAAIAIRMTCDVSVYWKWPIQGCNNTKVYNMSNFVSSTSS